MRFKMYPYICMDGMYIKKLSISTDLNDRHSKKSFFISHFFKYKERMHILKNCKVRYNNARKKNKQTNELWTIIPVKAIQKAISVEFLQTERVPVFHLFPLYLPFLPSFPLLSCQIYFYVFFLYFYPFYLYMQYIKYRIRHKIFNDTIKNQLQYIFILQT